MLPTLRHFRDEPEFSAAELVGLWKRTDRRAVLGWLSSFVISLGGQARKARGLKRLELARILHTLGTALLAGRPFRRGEWPAFRDGLRSALDAGAAASLESLDVFPEGSPAAWAHALHEAAFETIGRTIVFGEGRRRTPPASCLRSDEIIWGRASARLDLGGGWTDTPPYSLERGGCVINAAVTLNGQPPIHAYARVTGVCDIRLSSIDHGAGLRIHELDELLDYKDPASRFGLAKAALALSGFSPTHARWPSGVRTLKDMLRHFGGGIELTTLAAIPSGSGLGTSSIMGAVLVAVISRMTGRSLTSEELFYKVLQLEQELTTGGGWQDQVGGVLPGVKMISAEAELVPAPLIHYVPSDVLDPARNGGTTLLYYTGIRRLAKNILRSVVANYLDRDKATMDTLRQLHAYPPRMVEAMSRKDGRRFGELIDVAWNLNKRIDPDSTTPEIEGILRRIRKHIWGAKLLGAGGGGFLLIIGKSEPDAASVRRTLARNPPNPRARFFDYEIDERGLTVTVS
jgi:galactokinase/mevalonate kinase-like predicted kinase